jgi:hypothetical protein
MNAPEGSALKAMGRLHRHMQLEMLVRRDTSCDHRLDRPEVNAGFGF